MGTKQLVVQEALEMTQIFLRVEIVLVHAHHKRRVGVARRAGNNDQLGSGVEVCSGGLAGGEDSRRLNDDVDVELAPGKVGRIALGVDLDRAIADVQRVLSGADREIQQALGRVVLEEVGVGGRGNEVVDGDDLHVRAPEGGPQKAPSDASKSINRDPCCHWRLLFSLVFYLRTSSSTAPANFCTSCTSPRRSERSLTRVSMVQGSFA